MNPWFPLIRLRPPDPFLGLRSVVSPGHRKRERSPFVRTGEGTKRTSGARTVGSMTVWGAHGRLFRVEGPGSCVTKIRSTHPSWQVETSTHPSPTGTRPRHPTSSEGLWETLRTSDFECDETSGPTSPKCINTSPSITMEWCVGRRS